MKKLIAALIFVFLLVGIVGCSPAPTTTPTEPESAPATEAPAASSSWDEWNKFLVEYEAWADEYVEVMKKYKANPSDPSLSADYNKLATESADFSQKAAQIPTDFTPEQSAESTAILTRITEKISSAIS